MKILWLSKILGMTYNLGWREYIITLDMAKVSIQDGKSCLLWHDSWNDVPCSEGFPELFSFVHNQNSSYWAANTQDFYDLFHLPLSPEAFAQYQILQAEVQNVTLNNNPDQWSYLWGSVLFSSSRSYKHLIGHHQIHVAFKWLWKSCCQNKRKFFFSLVLQDRLNTRALLKRKHMSLPDYHCVMQFRNRWHFSSALPLPFLFGLLVQFATNYPQFSRCRLYYGKHKKTATSALLHGSFDNNVLVHLVNAKWCDFQEYTSFSQQV